MLPRKPHARETDEAPEVKAAPVVSPPHLAAPAPAVPAHTRLHMSRPNSSVPNQ